jgi:hypothetical protein
MIPAGRKEDDVTGRGIVEDLLQMVVGRHSPHLIGILSICLRRHRNRAERQEHHSGRLCDRQQRSP